VKNLLLLDYDNDGWLDILAYGSGVRVWRNVGKKGFEDTTAALGLEGVGEVDDVAMADFDRDGDTDLVLSSKAGLQYWRNEGGNANKQLKLQLVGNRSNPSAIGARVEVVSDHWRAIRTLHNLPFELGTGQHNKLELLKTRWFDLGTTLTEVPVGPEPLVLQELVVPSGSCPYLFVWDGHEFRFVSDILGASPLGLPVSETRYVEADPEEYLALGSDFEFAPRDGKFEVRITEELREVLYLDSVKMVAVDHPKDTEVHPTSKMLPGRPFLPHQLWTLRSRATLRQATRSDGLDVTANLRANDKQMVGPVKLREPQLRGLAEPFSLTFDFGALPVSEPLALVMNGWIRFGGGHGQYRGLNRSNFALSIPAA
jgi:hypothetical protein